MIILVEEIVGAIPIVIRRKRYNIFKKIMK
jgi:hypothetical protein